MNDFNLTLNARGGDTMFALATREATARFSVWGELSWTPRSNLVELPQDSRLVQDVQYEMVRFSESGDVDGLSLFVATSFSTVALIRISGEERHLIVWGARREAVGETVKAFLDEWPPRGSAETSVDEPGGVYL
jgi:hypothetical protein